MSPAVELGDQSEGSCLLSRSDGGASFASSEKLNTKSIALELLLRVRQLACVRLAARACKNLFVGV